MRWGLALPLTFVLGGLARSWAYVFKENSSTEYVSSEIIDIST